MSAISDRLKKRFTAFLQEPKGMELARGAIQAFDHCDARGSLTEEDFQPLVEAVSSSLQTPAEAGAVLLLDLAMRKPEARDCLKKLAKGGKMAARFNVLGYIYWFPELPAEFLAEIITLGLQDRSKKVKCHALDRAVIMKLPCLLGHLEAMQRLEKDPAILSSVEYSIAMLRDGYQVKPNDGGYFVNVRVKDGVTGRWISKQDYSESSVKQTVAEILADCTKRTTPMAPGSTNATKITEMDPVKMLESFAALAKANLVDADVLMQMTFIETGRLALDPELVLAHSEKAITEKLLAVAISIADGRTDRGTRSWRDTNDILVRAGVERFVQYVQRIREDAAVKSRA